MTEEEEIILTAIREGFQTPDAISKRIGRPVSHINRTITFMELKQMVAVTAGKIYIDVYKRQIYGGAASQSRRQIYADGG